MNNISGYEMTKIQRVAAMLGMQDKDMRDVSACIGVDIHTLETAMPYATFTGSDYNRGLYFDTNPLYHRQRLMVKCYGLLDYWLGVARCHELTNK